MTSAVSAEQVRTLFRQMPIALSVNFVNAALVAIVLTPFATRPFLLPWFVSVMLVTIGRGVLWVRYRHAAVRPENTRRWLWLATCASLISGLCWGIGGIILFPVLPALGQLFLITVMGGMCAGAVVISASHLPSLLAFLLATGLPMALRFFAQGLTRDSALAAMIVVFVAALSLAGRHFSKNFAEGLRLRFELKEANLRLAEANLRLQAETAEHRESEAAFRAAVNASPAAKIMVDANGLIEFANPMAERVFAYENSELIGQSIDILVPARSRAAHAGLRRGFAANPSARPMGADHELHGVRKDGSEFLVEIELTPVDSESGPIVLATIADITERRRTEAELAQRASDLELANQRLAQFAYVASHDLQEPLRKIAVYADLLEQAIAKSDRDDVARATRVIASSAIRARSLVQNLLAFARATSSETQMRPLDLRAEVELALSDLSTSIEETGARVTVDIPSITVPADGTQLRRLIQNVVSNAIKYHKPGAVPAIDIRAAPVGEAKAMLSIVDDGVGFDEKFAKEIFEPFKRLHDTAQYPGTGIGLAICKAIADRYGWTLGVQSRPGLGTSFTITLPRSG